MKVQGTITAIRFNRLRKNMHAYQPCCEVQLTDGSIAYWWADEIALYNKRVIVGTNVSAFIREDKYYIGESTLYRISVVG